MARAASRIPRIFGRQVFKGTFLGDAGSRETSDDIVLVANRNECEIFTADWLKALRVFPVQGTTCEANTQDVDVLRFFGARQNEGFDFRIRFERPEALKTIFAVNASHDVKSKTVADSAAHVTWDDILPFAVGLGTAPQSNATFNNFVELQARKRLLFLSGGQNVTPLLKIVVAIEFKTRFPEVEQENWSSAFEVLWFEYVAFCVSLWSQSLAVAIAPHTGDNSHEYFRRLAASTAGLMAKGADVFDVKRDTFLLAVKKYMETGDVSGVPEASRAIVDNVGSALANVRRRWLLRLTDLFEFAQVFSIGVTIAHAGGGKEESNEMKRLPMLLGSWALSLVDNLSRRPSVLEFRNAMGKLAVAVLKENDNRRYDPEFHCTLALWKLSELTKASE